MPTNVAADPRKMTVAQALAIPLLGSVGRKGAKNDKRDVCVVQILLTEIAKSFKLQQRVENKKVIATYPVDPKGIDGGCGKNTKTAIDNIQQWYYKKSDGRIDRNAKTINNMRTILEGRGKYNRLPANDFNLVHVMRQKIGQIYVLGAHAPYHNRNWMGPWDCAELVACGTCQPD